MNNTVAIILAAGRGTRFGADCPKQFCLLDRRPLVMTTINRFATTVGRDNILLIISREMEGLWLELCREYGFESPQYAFGGDTRIGSVTNALRCLAADTRYDDGTLVLVHDGARPLPTKAMIERMTHIPQGFHGVIPAVRVTDTLREINGDGTSVTVDRSRFVAIQTPQTFKLSTLLAAYAKASDSLTDDASVVETAGLGPVAIAEGEATNIKVTNPTDLAVAEAILRQQSEQA